MNEDQKIKFNFTKNIMALTNYAKLIRLHQPTGIWLLFLPCLFGIFLALKNLPNPDFFETLRVIALFFIGSIVMRSAGCILNDLLDQKFDKDVDRTKNRPLASGKVSRLEAMILLSALLFLGLLILVQFNTKTIWSGFVALTLLTTYPLMKRITYYPQIFLGLTFNFGILMSSFAITEEIGLDTLTLYFASIIWTVIYDTIYAYQDIENDLKIGVKSTAIKFKNNPKKILLSLNLLMLLTLIGLGWQSDFRSEFYILILVAAIFLNQKIRNCDFTNPKNCLTVFKQNIWIGFLILTAIFLG